MKTIPNNLYQNRELSKDVPVTSAIMRHAALFIAIVLLLFALSNGNKNNLLANWKKIPGTSTTQGQALSLHLAKKRY